MPNTGGVDISVLEGWLIKEKSQAPKYSFLGDSNKRWFKVQVLRGLEGEELALCYFKDNKSNEPKGWIFTRDITEIHEDKVSITIISPAKTMKVSAQTRAEHKLWAAGIRAICPDADFFALGGELMSPRAESRLKEAASTAAVPSDAKAEDKGMSPPITATTTAIPEEGGGKNTSLRRKSTTKIPPAAQEKEEEPKPIQASEAPRRESLREQDNGMTPRSKNRTDTPYDLDSVRRRADSNEEDNHFMGRPNSGNSRRSSRDSRDEDEYERWKEERRLQQTPPNSSSGSNRRSSGKGGDTATSPAISSQQPYPIAGGTMTSRVHQHIRSGSGSSSGTEALQEMDLPSENGGNSRSTAAPREFLKTSLEKKREPSPVVAKAPIPTPAPVAQAPPKVKRRAADGFDDDDEEDEWGQGGGTRTTKAVSNDERKMSSSSRGLLAAQRLVKDGILASPSPYALRLLDSSDSEDEKIDFKAEKVALSPSNVVAEEASAPGKITSEEGRNNGGGGGGATGDGSLSVRREGEGRRISPPGRESKASSSLSAGEVGPGPRGATAVSPPSSSQTIGGRGGSRVPAPQGPQPHRALPKTARVNRPPPSLINSPPSSSAGAASSLYQQQAMAIIRPDANFAEEDWDDSSDGEGVGTICGRPDGGGAKHGSSSGRRREGGGNGTEEKRSDEGGGGRASFDAGVKTDANWVHDDFDS